MHRGWLVLFAGVAGLVSWQIGDTYIARMSNPGGYHLVAVANELTQSPSSRPRRVVVVLADGLRLDAALGMRTTQRLLAAGQCRPTDVGAPSLSRAVYTVYSTGLEQDRTGIRNNDEKRPVAAQSIWQVARAKGLRVEGRSDVTWWRETFPDGFDTYAEKATFEAPRAAVTLIHPVGIDEAGHDFGAASARYAEEVAKVDGDFGRLLDGLDLERDLVVFLSDHGHTGRGGHGGRSPEVSIVLSCFAGHGVTHGGLLSGMLAVDVAPALAVLTGLPFPRHMRAGDDDLDTVLRIADVATLGTNYMTDRDIAIRGFRAANPSWPVVYEEGRSAQAWKLGALLALIVVVCGLGGGWRTGLWVAATAAAAVAAHIFIFGSFDVSGINKRATYVRMASLMWMSVALVAFLARWSWARDLGVAVRDQALLVAVGLLINLALPWIFGWPLGFPAPTPRFYFLPFFAGLGTVWMAAGLAAAAGVAWVARR